MEAPSGEFTFTWLEKIVFGPGKIGVLGEELARHGRARAVIATSASLGRSKLLDAVKNAMGARYVGVFDGCAQHAPAKSVRALTAELERLEADVVVSFGGGSAIDSAKVATASILNGRDMTLEGKALALGIDAPAQSGDQRIIHIAVPTTLSGGEYTSGGGVTDEATRRKRGVFDARIQAKLIIHDPALTVETPDWLWVSTGMRALDHAIESAYSVRHQPFTDALATKAIRLLHEHLPASVTTRGEEALAHRGFCQLAAWFSLFGGVSIVLGVSHALSHQIGPQWNVPHGVTSCITLPHAMRFVAGVAPERFGPIADGLGIVFDAHNPSAAAMACADRVRDFIKAFDVPNSLKAVGVERHEIGLVAEAARHEIERFASVGKPVTLEDVRGLLEAAYDPPSASV